MDRRRAIALVSAALVSAVGLIGVCATLVAQTSDPLLAARWLPKERRLQALSREPVECLAPAADPATARRLAIGRAAFRTPLLLGGQAARNGLSCNACHRNGRGNPDFFIAEVSDAPGTADVTTSRFSSHRGDGTFNPKPIPDLSMPDGSRKIPRDDGDDRLETFLRGLIVEEFDGSEPDRATLDGLAAYVRHLRSSACGGDVWRSIRLAHHLDDVRAGLKAAEYALDAGDAATARLMVASARTALQSIYERYPGSQFAIQRDALLAASRELASIERAIAGGTGDIDLRIATWLADMPRWNGPLQRGEMQSLYAADKLAQSLAGDDVR